MTLGVPPRDLTPASRSLLHKPGGRIGHIYATDCVQPHQAPIRHQDSRIQFQRGLLHLVHLGPHLRVQVSPIEHRGIRVNELFIPVIRRGVHNCRVGSHPLYALKLDGAFRRRSIHLEVLRDGSCHICLRRNPPFWAPFFSRLGLTSRHQNPCHPTRRCLSLLHSRAANSGFTPGGSACCWAVRSRTLLLQKHHCLHASK